MRSLAEIAFRARQEAANLWLLASAPRFRGEMPLTLELPDGQAVADRLRGSDYAAVIEATAHEVLAHRFPLLGVTIDTGPEIRWRRDYAHGVESGTAYFRRIPYLDFAVVGDHKFIWELNRHQHLVLLAQAFLFTGRKEFTQEIFAQLESWWEQNPFQRGINWASALEVGFRTLSWIWVYQFTAAEMRAEFRRRFLTELYRHGHHLAENLSVYFSPNTHLLGEAVALHALGSLFEAFPASEAWRKRGAEIVEGQIEFQVRRDGSHFEQSTYYHVYALDLFLFFYVVAGRPENLRPVLGRMGEYLDWLLGPARRIAFLGDDDGGRLFHPYGERDRFGRATLTTCGILLERDEWIGTYNDAAEQAAWWIGRDSLGLARGQELSPTGARLFVDSGAAFLRSGDLFVQMDAGPFGHGGAGHSHSDTLSLVVTLGDERVFVDPGTYTYADEKERNWFRSSAAHNTVRIDGLDQAQPAGPFRWASKPEVVVKEWQPAPEGGLVDASCRYSGFTHRRRVLLRPGMLLVFDELDGPDGEHICEQIWQLGSAASKVGLSFSAPATRSDSKFSPAYGKMEAGSSVTVRVAGPFPIRVAMLLETRGADSITIEEAERMLLRS